jgi:hypothetical protein
MARGKLTNFDITLVAFEISINTEAATHQSKFVVIESFIV